MGYLDNTGLAYLWGKIKNLLATGTAQKAQSIPFGEVDSTSTANAFTATVEGITALEDGVCVYLKNTVITSAAASTAPKCWTLNVNDLGAKPVYVTTAATTYSTTQFTVNYKFLFTYDSSLNSGNGGWYIGLLYNTNTTYSTITQEEIDAGTGTKARNITPKLLRDNFYTEDEVDGLLVDKADSADLATVATSGSYNDLDNKPDIPSAVTESTVSGWGFTKNTGTITGITMNGASKGTSGVVNLGTVVTEHQDISGKANSADVYTKTQVDDMIEDVAYFGDTVGNVTTADFNAQTDTVWNKAQVLGSTQQAQARANISAQEALVSGTNIKTINNESILGSGNITISGGSGGGGNVTVDTALSTASTNPVQNAIITTNLNNKAEKIAEVNHDTSDTSLALTPNVLHVWGTVGSLTLTLGTGESGVMNEYMFQFDSGSTATTLSLPSSVKWITDNTIEANKTYQVSILNNLAVMGGA